jgi:hypothetical protein
VKHHRHISWVAAATIAGFALNCAQAADGPGVIANNESIFVDGKTFGVIRGRAGGDASAQIKNLGAREMGPGMLIFRSGEKLFVVDAPLAVRADAAQPNRIIVQYVPPKKPEHQKLHDVLKEHRVLETLQQVLSPFRLPVELTIRTMDCGMVNAWFAYEDSRPTITLCYEYLQAITTNVPQDVTAAGVTPTDALIGQFFYVVVHEFGHALFAIYDVPVFGSEEDAADRFAALILLQFEKDAARRLVGGAAYSYRRHITARKDNPKVTIPLAAFSSSHGQPEQRFYNLLCMAYGANPEQFAFLVDDEYLPKTRAPNCAREFKTVVKAFHREISPHIDRELAGKVLNTRWLAQMQARQ